MKVLLITLFLFFAVYSYAAESPLPKNFVFNTHGKMSEYTPYIIPCVNWLQQTPLNEQQEERKRVDEFVLYWLQINPDMSISMPDYSITFHRIRRELLYLFLESWIKYTLETNDKDFVRCNLAGLTGMLDYYMAGKAGSPGKTDYLDNLQQIRLNGGLKALFDTTAGAKNTYLFLSEHSGRHDLKHNENYLAFSFYSINILRPRDITYRYKLEGYYDEWITTKEGAATYPRLPPGSYTFTVQASMWPGFARPVTSSYSFTIARPVWQEVWFLTLAGASLLLLIYFIIRQRERNLQHIARLKHERIVFEYEHLKSQVNPHFLFNSLNTLAHLIAKDQKKAIDYTENLSDLYHNILAYHENDYVVLSDELEILKKYIWVQQGRFGHALQLHIDIPESVLTTKKIVPLALQMLIENVLKHNTLSAAEPMVILITANEEEITIRNRIFAKLSKEKGEGLGLLNIKRRYELLTRKPVTYGVQKDEYIVILPLL